MRIVGGALVSQKALPGGDIFLPFTELGSDMAVARKQVDLIREGVSLVVAGDSQRGAQTRPVTDHGFRFDLPLSVPKLVHRYNLPVFWLSTYWQNGALVCDLAPAPAPATGETFDAYCGRWNPWYLDRMRAVAAADPANIVTYTRITPTA